MFLVKSASLALEVSAMVLTSEGLRMTVMSVQVHSLADLRQKPDFLLEEPRGHKRTLQWRYGIPTELGRNMSASLGGDFSLGEYPDKFAGMFLHL